jgi:hypothetical protein
VQYTCDLDTTVPITVPFTGTELRVVYTTNTQAFPTVMFVEQVAVADEIRYVLGSVGTGPWPTATSTSLFHYNGPTDTGAGSNSVEDAESVSLRKRTTKIAVGVAVPIAVSLLAALWFLCRRRTKTQSANSRGPESEVERAARLAALNASKARVDTEMARAQQVNALEQEQARIQAEIERLRSVRS